jgi:hypothetical protein
VCDIKVVFDIAPGKDLAGLRDAGVPAGAGQVFECGSAECLASVE